MLSYLIWYEKYYSIHDFWHVLDDQDKKLIRDIGERIRKLRTKQNLSIAQVAFELGTSESYVQRIETGKVNTGIVALNRIAIVLNTPLSKIVED